jgi:hypothetical protein
MLLPGGYDDMGLPAKIDPGASGEVDSKDKLPEKLLLGIQVKLNSDISKVTQFGGTVHS